MWHVYILQSSKNGRFYIGSTKNLSQRLYQHNAGLVTATRFIRPLAVVYNESFETRSDAYARERWLKSQKSRLAIDALIKGSGKS